MLHYRNKIYSLLQASIHREASCKHALSVTFLHCACSKGEDGALTFALPLPADSKQPYADPTSALGSVTAALLESPEQYRNQVVPVIGEWLTATELVEKFTEVTGVPAG